MKWSHVGGMLVGAMFVYGVQVACVGSDPPAQAGGGGSGGACSCTGPTYKRVTVPCTHTEDAVDGTTRVYAELDVSDLDETEQHLLHASGLIEGAARNFIAAPVESVDLDAPIFLGSGKAWARCGRTTGAGDAPLFASVTFTVPAK